MTVVASQRFTQRRRCPVCGGYDQAGRGQGVRCWGFLSEDGSWAHCTRAEHAGHLDLTDGSETYAHRLVGRCGCGVEHEPQRRPSNGSSPKPQRRIVAVADFVDEAGTTQHQEVRYIPKDFRPRRPDGNGGWIYNMDGVRRVPYNLPALQAAEPNDLIFICEGPKDADLLTKAGLLATTNDGGAHRWPSEFKEYLRDSQVIIMEDNDGKGRKRTQFLATSLSGTAASIKVIDFPDRAEGYDVSDWLDDGHTIDELRELAASAPEWEPEASDQQVTGEESPVTAHVGQSSGSGEHLTDLGNARRMVARHGSEMHFSHAWRKWLSNDGRRWAIDNTAEILRRAKETVASIYTEAGEAPDATERKTLADHAKRSEAESRIKAMISLAESEPGIPVRPDELDRDPWLLNVQNGTLDLRTGELLQHNPDDLITKLAPVVFDPDAKAPIWDAFLERILPDVKVRTFLQRLIGYSMTGLTIEQIIAFLIGNGANGKSTLIEILLTLLGDYAKIAAPGMLLTSRGDRHPTELADLHGARFVSTVEVGEGRRLKEDLIKQLTGGDTIKARRMHENFWEFTPTHQLFVAANLKPEVRGTDLAIWRRLIVIPFNVTIPPAEQDKNLAQKLKAELPGILAWAVRGCLSWQRDGLGASEEVVAATANYRAEQDALAQFLEERCVEGDGYEVRAASAFKEYLAWANAQGLSERERLTNKAFGTRMVARFERVKTPAGRVYHGVGLIAEREPGSAGLAGSVTAPNEMPPREETPPDATHPTPDAGSMQDCESSVPEIDLFLSVGPRVEKTLKSPSHPSHPSPTVNAYAAERDFCLGTAQALGYPEIELGPGRTIPGGEAIWLRFAANGNPDDLEDARAALDRLGKEQGE